jgi:hypothetical protein
MPFKVVSQKGFLKGVIASMDRFNITKGAIQRASNFLLSQRGALTVCDGTGTIASDPSGGNPGFPIYEMGVYVNPFNFGITPIMGSILPSTPALRIYSFGLTPVSGFTFQGAVGLTPGWIMPQFVPFAGVMCMSLGNNTPIVKWDPANYTGTPDFSNLSYDNTGPAGAAGWHANTFYTIGQRIAALDGNGVNSTWQVVNITIGSTTGSMSNTSGVGGGGLSGTTEPNFGDTSSATKGTGQTIADNQIIWMCLKQGTSLAMQFPPHGAAHIIKHANALWAFNTAPSTTSASGSIDGPSVLRMSDPNNSDSWPLGNTATVGQDDGTQGTGIATFTIAEAGITPSGTLVLFKDYSTYTVTGVFQAQNFQVTQVKTDMGCTASRSVAFATGFGVIRFCHLGFALFDGINDRLISEEVRPYIFGGVSPRDPTAGVDFSRLNQAHAALTTDPPMYVCVLPTTDGNTTRIFCYDLVMRAWMVVDYLNGSNQFPITCLRQLRPPIQSGFNATTVIADLGPGNVASIRRWQGGDAAWDATSPPTPVQWNFRPPEVGEPGSRAYFRRANVRLTAPQSGQLTGFFSIGDESQPNNVQNNGGAGPSSGTPPNIATQANYYGDEDLGVALDIHQTGPSLNGTYSGSGPANIEGVDYHITAKEPRPFGQRW